MGSMEVMEHDLTNQGINNFFVFTGGLLMTHRDAGRRLTAAVGRRIPPSGSKQPLDYSARLVPEGDQATEASVRHAVEREQAHSLEDILRRRLSLGWGEDLGLAHVEAVSVIAAPLLGWTEGERRTNVEAYVQATISDFNPRDPHRWNKNA